MSPRPSSSSSGRGSGRAGGAQGSRAGGAQSSRAGGAPAPRQTRAVASGARIAAAGAPGRNGGTASRGARGRGGKGQQESYVGRTTPQGLGGEQIEGRRAVRELLAAESRRVREIWVAEGVDDNEVIAEIVEMAAEQRVKIQRVPRARLDAAAKSDAPQGVLALAQPIRETPLEELCQQQGDSKPFLLAFDGVTDPHNLGSLVRTGECNGVTGVVLPRHRSVHVTPTVAKASAGAIEHVPMALVPGLPAALTTVKDLGVWTVGLDMDGDVDIQDLEVADQPVMLIFGAEGAGLSRLTKQRCDVIARIPQYGNVASLNVSAAGAIACFEVARRRSAAK